MRWRALGLVACLSVACRRAPAPQRPSAPSAEPAPSPVAAAIDSVLVGVRARASLAAPEWQLQRLAFGQHLFGVLGAAGVRTYALPGATLLIDHPLASPSGIV